MEQFTE